MGRFLMIEAVLLAIAMAIVAMAFPPSAWRARPRLRNLADRTRRERDGSTAAQRSVWIALVVLNYFKTGRFF
jgi:hypothetical protein